MSRARTPGAPAGADTEVASAAVAAAVLGRRLFPRGGDLEPNEAQVLLSLFARPARTARELAVTLELATTTVSHAIGALQQRGFLQDDDDPTDRRRRPQSITPA